MSIQQSARRLQLLLIDCNLFIFIYACSVLLSGFSSSSVALSANGYVFNGLIFLLSLLISRIVFRVYFNIWRYANSRAYLQLVLADIVGGLFALGVTWHSGLYVGIWQSCAVVALFVIASLSIRFCYQQYYRHQNIPLSNTHKIGVAIIGAGQIGSLLAEELLYNPDSHYQPMCFVDIDPVKIGSRLCGLPVYAGNKDVLEKLKALPIQEILIAISAPDGQTLKRMRDFYSQIGCKIMLYDLPYRELSNAQTTSQKRVLREIHIEDLLFRNSMTLSNPESDAFYAKKVILVTGGGGSIGSELCRQLAKRRPAQLIIVDIYENNAYDIQQELIRSYGNKLNLAVEIASVRDRQRLDAIFACYHPDIVFHAAAHKHVPLMEHSGCEAIKNNILGTYNTADMAEKYGVKKFILISTDKAVNPTNIMGASKRVCEMVIQCRTNSKTSFSAVRFGNVLGSNGSVIPLFQRQIENGGPITITDKRIIRYFMTIPEASQLVMQAGAMAKSGELFVLDMGSPVKILDLAENMIRLSGFTPYVDIDIKEIGLRPGEKLYEELLMKKETTMKTGHDLIFVEMDKPLSRQEVDEKISILRQAIDESGDKIDPEQIRQAMMSVVPTYCDPDTVNQSAASADEMQQVQTAKQSVPFAALISR